MHFKNPGTIFVLALTILAVIILVPIVKYQQITTQYAATTTSPIKTVFIILMENHNWVDIKASSPYLANTLLPMGAHAEQYYNPPGNHPSLPNYIWLESGTNFGIQDDNDPAINHQTSKNHLVTLLQAKGIAWKAYEEDISGTDCPLTAVSKYAPKHNPFIYFDDVTNTNNSQSQNCIQHIRPYSELATDLANNTVTGYNFITPNLCDDTHDCSIATGDTWLSKEVPKILNSQAYKNGGALFITYDEGENGNQDDDGPIGMVVLSPLAKTNYTNTIHYTHSSTLKTLEEIFGVTPFLADAANATDLSDFFTVPLSGVQTSVTPNPSAISTVTPTISGNTTQFLVAICPHGFGTCGDNANPTGSGTLNPTHLTRNVTVSLFNASNQPVATAQGSVSFDPTKHLFTGSIAVPGVGAGQYLVSVKMNGFLAKQIPGIQTVTAGQTVQLPQVSLVIGDINNDNQVDILDYNMLISCYGTKASSPSCTDKNSADINDDGSIDAADYNLFLRELSVQQGN